MRHQTLLLLQWLVVFMFVVVVISEAKEHVIIANELGADLELTVHCKSKEDDLGIQKILYNGNYSFTFKPNIWMTTQFFCSFQWKNTFHRFDIYVDERDFEKCNDVCSWQIQANGPCMLNHYTKLFDICYNWDPSHNSFSNGVQK